MDVAIEDVQQRVYRRADFYIRVSLQMGEHRVTTFSLAKPSCTFAI